MSAGLNAAIAAAEDAIAGKDDALEDICLLL